jgi:hypothetical protein
MLNSEEIRRSRSARARMESVLRAEAEILPVPAELQEPLSTPAQDEEPE